MGTQPVSDRLKLVSASCADSQCETSGVCLDRWRWKTRLGRFGLCSFSVLCGVCVARYSGHPTDGMMTVFVVLLVTWRTMIGTSRYFIERCFAVTASFALAADALPGSAIPGLHPVYLLFAFVVFAFYSTALDD